MFEDETRLIIGACIAVHKRLGPGLLEAVYQECLEVELGRRAIPFVAQPIVRFAYDNVQLRSVLQPDLVVFDSVVVELKSVMRLHPLHTAQLRTYLKLLNKKIGLLANFNVELMRTGIRRVLNPHG